MEILYPYLYPNAWFRRTGLVRETCEMALSDAVGKNYESILYLADECTR